MSPSSCCDQHGVAGVGGPGVYVVSLPAELGDVGVLCDGVEALRDPSRLGVAQSEVIEALDEAAGSPRWRLDLRRESRVEGRGLEENRQLRAESVRRIEDLGDVGLAADSDEHPHLSGQCAKR